ncbi:UNVERIFIED_CONTAM: hypothetical protein K2H54_000732 [Gekko kuhli]
MQRCTVCPLGYDFSAKDRHVCPTARKRGRHNCVAVAGNTSTQQSHTHSSTAVALSEKKGLTQGTAHQCGYYHPGEDRPSDSTAPKEDCGRQRLAHLSAEEKALRRKLKNRVAAQSARDRKKARMGELERQAVELEAQVSREGGRAGGGRGVPRAPSLPPSDAASPLPLSPARQNQELLAENRALRERTLSLAAENRELRLRLALPAPPETPKAASASWDGGGEQEEEQQQLEEEEAGARSAGEEVEVEVGLGPATGSAESAALRLRVPLQQGQAQQSPPREPPSTPWWMLRAALALSLISSWAFWTAWTQTCFCTTAARSQHTWSRCSSSRRRRSSSVQEKQVPYRPLLVFLWGPHCPSWKPLMN